MANLCIPYLSIFPIKEKYKQAFIEKSSGIGDKSCSNDKGKKSIDKVFIDVLAGVYADIATRC